jgi:hypothetical protein
MSAVNGRSVREAEPERAVPSGRVGYDLDAEKLLLHTVQTAQAFDALITKGTLRPDPELAEANFADAYEFLFADPGGARAVFLLPAVPSVTADALATIITTHVIFKHGRAQLPLTRLHAAIAPPVPRQVLDDVVLFLNERAYLS